MVSTATGLRTEMARQHAIVKRLASVEKLGCTTVMAWADWGLAVGAASLVLLLEEVRKLGVRTLHFLRR